jgi:hypothetical protein
MLSCYKTNLYNLLYRNIAIESYYVDGVCTDCVQTGKYNQNCDVCGQNKQFPDEFKFVTNIYPKYPDSETEKNIICEDCLINNSAIVIDMLANSDKTEILE